MLLKDLQTLATKLATGTLFHVEKAGKAYSVDYSALAKAIIEEYADSTVGGSKQSVQAAITALNSRIDATYSTVASLYNAGVASGGCKAFVATGEVAQALTNNQVAGAARGIMYKADGATVDALLFSLAGGKLILSRIANGVPSKAYYISLTQITMS